MNNGSTSLECKIDRQYITARITFALKNIPQVDEFTLIKLIELLNTTGTFGSITAEQLVEEMKVMLKYVPGTCGHTLLILLDLLNVCLPLSLKHNDNLVSALQNHPKLISTS